MYKIKNILYGFVATLLLVSCGEPLDASKVETQQYNLAEFNAPIDITIPKTDNVAVTATEVEDMLVYETFTITLNTDEHFAVELACSTLDEGDMNAILAEQKTQVTAEAGFEKIIELKPDGFLFLKTEINGDENYGFVKVIKYNGGFAIASPKPAADGSLSLEKTQYIFDILNKP